jgi:hypothetical protein
MPTATAAAGIAAADTASISGCHSPTSPTTVTAGGFAATGTTGALTRKRLGSIDW